MSSREFLQSLQNKHSIMAKASWVKVRETTKIAGNKTYYKIKGILYPSEAFSLPRINIVITNDLLPSCLVAQSIEQWSIESGGRGLDSH